MNACDRTRGEAACCCVSVPRADIRRFFRIVGMPSFLARFSLSKEDRAALEQIVASEWEQFGEVNGMDGRASCQDDAQGFFAYRVAQYVSFPREGLVPICEDIVRARSDGRNVVQEKYARMMAQTDPAAYDRVWRPRLREPSPVKAQALHEVASLIRGFAVTAATELPHAHAHGRVDESVPGAVSACDYYLAEIAGYSLRTLYRLRDGLLRLRREGANPVSDTYANSVLILKALEVGSYGKAGKR